MTRSFIFATAFIFFRLASSIAYDAPAMNLIWIDSYELFPPTGRSMLQRNVEELFESNGMHVRLHVMSAEEDLATLPRPCVHAIAIPSVAEAWGLQSDAVAAAIGERGKRYNIFVFYPSLQRAIGQSSNDLSPRDVAYAARATARVLAHELVHVLAPELGHAGSGLMFRKLGRQALLSETIELDELRLRAARARLERWTAGDVSVPPPPLRPSPSIPGPS